MARMFSYLLTCHYPSFLPLITPGPPRPQEPASQRRQAHWGAKRARKHVKSTDINSARCGEQNWSIKNAPSCTLKCSCLKLFGALKFFYWEFPNLVFAIKFISFCNALAFFPFWDAFAHDFGIFFWNFWIFMLMRIFCSSLKFWMLSIKEDRNSTRREKGIWII